MSGKIFKQLCSIATFFTSKLMAQDLDFKLVGITLEDEPIPSDPESEEYSPNEVEQKELNDLIMTFLWMNN